MVRHEASPDPIASAAALGRAIHGLRRDRGETGEQFGALIGLSKGKVSELERGLYAPSVSVALKIEELSRGGIDAADLCADVRAARHGLTEAAPDQAEA